MSVVAPHSQPMAVARRSAGRRAATIGLLGVLLLSLIFALPALRPVVDEVRDMNGWWIAAAIALELASCISFVALFRLFFDRVAARASGAAARSSKTPGMREHVGGIDAAEMRRRLLCPTGV